MGLVPEGAREFRKVESRRVTMNKPEIAVRATQNKTSSCNYLLSTFCGPACSGSTFFTQERSFSPFYREQRKDRIICQNHTAMVKWRQRLTLAV